MGVVSIAANIILGILVIVLGGLLILRQRQLRQARPLTDLDKILETLQSSLLANRSEGNIQTVAGQLTNVLIQHLRSDHILFFRRQRRFMEMNYVYGLKGISRPRYRINLSEELIRELTNNALIRHPEEVKDLLSAELNDLLLQGRFNLIFPIFWQDNVFGVYFISTRFPIDHPMIKTFLMFLNHNLSATYQIKRLESARLLLEQKSESDRKLIQQLEAVKNRTPEGDEYPGHLIEMFNHRKVDELVASLFDKVKAGLQTDRLLFVSPRVSSGDGGLRYAVGMDKDALVFNGAAFDKIVGRLNKRQVYGIDQLTGLPEGDRLRGQLEKAKVNNLSAFSLSENEPGLLLWQGLQRGDQPENRLLARLEKVAQRAMANAREFERVEAMSYTDSLTRLYNHRYFIKRMAEEIQRATRYQRGLGLLLFDIDDFKLYNDGFGHQWGDELLRRMGATLNRILRAIDIVSRYGGDEFCIIMPEADRATCRVFMDRLRHTIANTDFRDRANGFEGRVTISIGSAVFPDDAADGDRLIYCADMALLRAKAAGRNCGLAYSVDVAP